MYSAFACLCTQEMIGVLRMDARKHLEISYRVVAGSKPVA
jgi:hypothetical protein